MIRTIRRISAVTALAAAVLATPAAADRGEDPDDVAPATAPGKGNVVGTVKARSHKDFLEKVQQGGGGGYIREEAGEGGGGFQYTPEMVDYEQLEGIYVALLGPATPPATHELTVGPVGFSRRSLALATGDVIRITNQTDGPLTFFVADPDSDAFQELPPTAPGAVGEMKVEIAGDLELAADENERLVAALLVRPGLRSRRIASGDDYLFKDLDPGLYRLLFWYWRLGYLERDVAVEPDAEVRADATLSVDTIVK